jgi:hypothetical protein
MCLAHCCVFSPRRSEKKRQATLAGALSRSYLRTFNRGAPAAGFILSCHGRLLISHKLPVRTGRPWRSVPWLAGNTRAPSCGLLCRGAPQRHDVRARRDRGTLRLFGARLLAFACPPNDQLDFVPTTTCLPKPISPNCAFLFLGDPEAMEYGDFDSVHQECKDDCAHQRSSHHK